MPLTIKLGDVAKPPQATIELQIRKTLDGSLIISDHHKMDIVVQYFILISMEFSIFNSAVNVFIYALYSRKFRKAYTSVLRLKCKKLDSEDIQNDS